MDTYTENLIDEIERCAPARRPDPAGIPPGPALDAWDAAERPSQILRLAIADLRACASDPRYLVNFNHWHQGTEVADGAAYERKWCKVCLAGAVMAQRLGAPLALSLGPAHYDKKTAVRFLALNDFRSGYIWAALEKLGIDGATGPAMPFRGLPYKLPVKAYEDEPEAFFRDLEAVAQALDAVGY